MTRDGFMKELAYLLQDIQDEDKEDALQYYMDYFDEAGPDREDEVIREFPLVATKTIAKRTLKTCFDYAILKYINKTD